MFTPSLIDLCHLKPPHKLQGKSLRPHYGGRIRYLEEGGLHTGRSSAVWAWDTACVTGIGV